VGRRGLKSRDEVVLHDMLELAATQSNQGKWFKEQTHASSTR